MIDYKKSKTFKLICNVTNLQFIGGCCEPLSSKKSHYLHEFRSKKNKQILNSPIRKVLENDNCSIILIENFPCDSKEELDARVYFHITQNICVNLDKMDLEQVYESEKKVADYNKSKIYKITCLTTNKVYYGSTSNTLAQRKAKHIWTFKNKKDGSDKSAFTVLENDNFEMSLVEEYPCSSLEELKFRERWWIQNNDCVNKLLPISLPEDVVERRNTDEAKQKKHEHYIENKEEIYAKNKERGTERVTCECGIEINKWHLKKHMKRKVHLDKMKVLASMSKN